MEHQNRPVEWITTETEKIAKDKENTTVRDAALLAGGVGAAAGASNINFKPVNKRKANLKTFLAQSGKVGIYTGAGAAALGQGMASYADHAAKKTKSIGEAMALMDAANAARDLRTQGLLNVASGAGSLMISKRIHPNPVNKKLLAAKLGLIAGGTAAAAAGAHGLMKEKKASDINIRFGGKDKDDPKSGWKRAGKALAGHIAFPIIGATTALGGVGVHEAASHLKNKKLRRVGKSVGNILGLGGTLAGVTAPFIHDAYQASKYIQEH